MSGTLSQVTRMATVEDPADGYSYYAAVVVSSDGRVAVSGENQGTVAVAISPTGNIGAPFNGTPTGSRPWR